MLFNSYTFIFCFLPLTYIGYRILVTRFSGNTAIAFLVLASLVYYGWWNPKYLVLIVGSMVANYQLGKILSFVDQHDRPVLSKFLLAGGITGNLGLLGFFKYADFVVETPNFVAGTSYSLFEIVLPLAISFFTFQQIGYLVDVYQRKAHEYEFIHYALFVTFFPQLIAGPIVHHKEMLPQFESNRGRELTADFVVGSTIFVLGLFKKVVLADGIAPYSTNVFNAAAAGEEISFLVAWGGALSYTFQLYFDFSGYS